MSPQMLFIMRAIPERIVAGHAPVGVDPGKPLVAEASKEGPQVKFPILPTGQMLQPGSEPAERFPPPQNSRGLPRNVQGEKPVKVVLGCLNVPEQIAIPRSLAKKKR